MCRLFGFRSGVPGQVHRALVHEQNSLRQQSHEHKDGWGIAYYEDGFPSVAHGLGAAHGDPEFERVSAKVTSHTVVAHVRLASIGRVVRQNAHPFLYGRWAFAHNGTVRDYALHQAKLEERIAPHFRRLLVGETDSERCFYLLLTALERRTPLETATLDHVAAAIAEVTRFVAGTTDRPDAEKPTSLNFMITNGELLAASRRHRTLFFSERKHKSRTPHVEPVPGTKLEQLVIASEKLEAEHHWHEVPEGAVIGCDAELRLRLYRADELATAA